MLRIIRVFLLIFVVFATTAIYIQAQTVYHSTNWLGAIKEILMNDWEIALAAMVILAIYVWLELREEKKRERESLRNYAILKAIAQKMGIDVDNLNVKKGNKE